MGSGQYTSHHDEVLGVVHFGRVCWAEMHPQRSLWKVLQALGLEKHDELLQNDLDTVSLRVPHATQGVEYQRSFRYIHLQTHHHLHQIYEACLLLC